MLKRPLTLEEEQEVRLFARVVWHLSTCEEHLRLHQLLHRVHAAESRVVLAFKGEALQVHVCARARALVCGAPRLVARVLLRDYNSIRVCDGRSRRHGLVTVL